MTKNELVQKISENMPKFEGTDEEIEIKKALYVYITLGKMKSFDERYFFGNISEAKKIVEQAKSDKKDIDSITKKRKIICITLSYLYKEILKELGIYSYTVEDNEFDDHVSNIIILKNRKAISADLQLDLYCINAKMRVRFFRAIGEENFLPIRKLDKMLMELGYINSIEDYRDNVIENLKGKVLDLSLEEILKTILESRETYSGMEGVETSEAYKYYLALQEEVLGKKKAKKMRQFSCVRRKENGENDYTFCIYADTGDYRTVTPYLYSIKHGRMLPITLEKIRELEEGGLKLGNFRTQLRVRKLKKYIEQADKEKEDEKGR